ncbi:MAG: site-specific integrase [Coriobacteriales bacterium]|jgi:integrase|nr:site-specific integrase [Coriobacteriales bacterium]
MTFAELAHEWLDGHAAPSVSPTTYDQYRADVRSRIVPAMGRLDVADVGHAALQRGIYAVAEQRHRKRRRGEPVGYATSTLRRTAFVMASIHRYGASVGYTAPAVYRFKMPRCRDHDAPRVPKCLDREGAEAVLAAAVRTAEHPEAPFDGSEGPVCAAHAQSARRYALGCLLGLAGLRIGEVCGVRRADFDFKGGTVRVERGVRTYRGKGGTGWVTDAGPTKSRASRRSVPLPPEHAALLERLAPEGWLIPGGRTRADVPCKRGYGVWFKRFIAACGHPELSFHGLRHTCGTLLLEEGVDIKTIADILGHSNVSTTANIYLHPDERSKAEAVSRLGWGQA